MLGWLRMPKISPQIRRRPLAVRVDACRAIYCLPPKSLAWKAAKAKEADLAKDGVKLGRADPMGLWTDGEGALGDTGYVKTPLKTVKRPKPAKDLESDKATGVTGRTARTGYGG